MRWEKPFSRGAPGPSASWWLCIGPSPVCPGLSCIGWARTGPSTEMCPTSTEHREWISSHDLLAEYSLPSTAQEADGNLCHEDTVLTHGQLGVHQELQSGGQSCFPASELPVRPTSLPTYLVHISPVCLEGHYRRHYEREDISKHY